MEILFVLYGLRQCELRVPLGGGPSAADRHASRSRGKGGCERSRDVHHRVRHLNEQSHALSRKKVPNHSQLLFPMLYHRVEFSRTETTKECPYMMNMMINDRISIIRSPMKECTNLQFDLGRLSEKSVSRSLL